MRRDELEFKQEEKTFAGRTFEGADIRFIHKLRPEQSAPLAEALQRRDLTHDEFYGLLRSVLTPKDVLVHLLAMSLEADPREMVRQLVEACGSQEYISLLVEPHIILRLDNFIEFIHTIPKPLPSPNEIREAYIATFPTKKYYRSIITSDEVAQALSQNGFSSRVMDRAWDDQKANNRGQDAVSNALFSLAEDADFLTHIEMGGTDESFFQSASVDPDFSEAVVRYLQERDRPEELQRRDKIQTYEITVNSFYAVPIETQENLQHEVSEGAHWEIKKNFRTKKIPMDPYPEQLLSLHIPPQNIRLLRSLEVRKAPRYKFVGTRYRIEDDSLVA